MTNLTFYLFIAGIKHRFNKINIRHCYPTCKESEQDLFKQQVYVGLIFWKSIVDDLILL